MNHLHVFSHLYFGTNIFHSTFLKNICHFGNFITACMQKTQNKNGNSPSTRQNILIFHQNPLQHPISALSASHVIIYSACVGFVSTKLKVVHTCIWHEKKLRWARILQWIAELLHRVKFFLYLLTYRTTLLLILYFHIQSQFLVFKRPILLSHKSTGHWSGEFV